MSEKRPVYFRNKARSEKRNKDFKWVPEYVRLNVEPEAFDTRQDFKEEAIRKGGRRAAPAVPQAPQAPRTPQVPRMAKRQMIPVVGQNQDFLMDGEAPNPVEEFKFDNVPAPPEMAAPEPVRETIVVDDPRDEDKSIDEGDFCIFVDGELVYTTQHKNDAEFAVDALLDSGELTLDNITVFKRLHLRFGVSVD